MSNLIVIEIISCHMYFHKLEALKIDSSFVASEFDVCWDVAAISDIPKNDFLFVQVDFELILNIC